LNGDFDTSIIVDLDLDLRSAVSLDKLEALKAQIDHLEEALLPSLIEAAGKIAVTAQAYAPKKTGYLANNIVSVGPEVISRAPYSLYVEYGTRPHMIFPRFGKFLHFQRKGVDYFVSHVHHPGTAGSYFMRRALDQCMPEVMSRLRLMVSALLRTSE
jgi:hypothetical protein